MPTFENMTPEDIGLSDQPVWDAKISVSQFIQLSQPIVRIDLKTDIHRGVEWIAFTTIEGEVFTVPLHWKLYFKIHSSIPSSSLVNLTPLGYEYENRLNELKAWDTENKEERALYERLKEKFGDN